MGHGEGWWKEWAATCLWHLCQKHHDCQGGWVPRGPVRKDVLDGMRDQHGEGRSLGVHHVHLDEA